MQLLRNVTYEKGIGGLQDVVVGNACRFSDSGGLQPGFVQVINVRGNHWITLSNLLCTIDQTCVYDSYLDLNVKTAIKKVSYPVEVDIAACELAKREKSFTMLVEEIQQQEGGNDCGLFAIAYAVLLCFNEDPCKATYDQDIMRDELIKSFEDMDIVRYKNNVVTIDNSKRPKILYEWTCSVHCSCRKPDDGSEMGECSECKVWFHKECVETSFTDNWLCRQCAYKARQDAAQEEWARKKLDTMLKNSVENVSANRKLSRKYPDRNKTVQELYAAIAKDYDKFDFPEAKSSIGCANWKEYLEANQIERMNPCLGITSSCGTFEKRDFFVLIFPSAFTSDKQLICTVIHEMAHIENEAKAKKNLPGHGTEFKKAARAIIKSVEKHRSGLPERFRDTKLDKKFILTRSCGLEEE